MSLQETSEKFSSSSKLKANNLREFVKNFLEEKLFYHIKMNFIIFYSSLSFSLVFLHFFSEYLSFDINEFLLYSLTFVLAFVFILPFTFILRDSILNFLSIIIICDSWILVSEIAGYHIIDLLRSIFRLLLYPFNLLLFNKGFSDIDVPEVFILLLPLVTLITVGFLIIVSTED